jgi:hypothetical protein
MTHPVLQAVLSGLTGLEGFRMACLVDPVTGTLVEVVPASADPRHVEVASAGLSDLVQAVTGMGARLTPASEAQDVVVTLTEACYVVRLLPLAPAGPLALLLVIDRGPAVLAFALRAVRQVALDGTTAS